MKIPVRTPQLTVGAQVLNRPTSHDDSPMPALALPPLHTRMLSIRLAWGEGGALAAEGRIVDIRKRGLVPLLGKLQGPGIVHDMAVAVRLRGDDLEIESIEPRMAAYPFAPRQQTGGEACPDILGRVQGLRGAVLGDAYDARLVGEIGGPRGCFHVSTLLRLLGPAVREAVARDRDRRSHAATPVAGTPVFARSVIIDGVRGEGLRLALRGILFDLDYVPGADALPIEEEMAESFEANADVEIEVPEMTIAAASGRVRRGGHAIDRPGEWTPVPRIEELAGLTMYKGYTAEVQKRFADSDQPLALQHLLFMMAPALIQCMPSLMDEVAWQPRRAESSRGAVDSCHMWRADGPLMRA